jgi:hypothetical protein
MSYEYAYLRNGRNNKTDDELARSLDLQLRYRHWLTYRLHSSQHTFRLWFPSHDERANFRNTWAALGCEFAQGDDGYKPSPIVPLPSHDMATAFSA